MVWRRPRQRGGGNNEHVEPPPLFSLSLTLLAVGACIRAPVLALGQAGHGVALRRRGTGLETNTRRAFIPPSPLFHTLSNSHARLDVGRSRHRRAKQQQQRHQSAGRAHCGGKRCACFPAGRPTLPAVPVLLGWLVCCPSWRARRTGEGPGENRDANKTKKCDTKPCFVLFPSCSRRPRPPPPGRPATPAATGPPCG